MFSLCRCFCPQQLTNKEHHKECHNNECYFNLFNENDHERQWELWTKLIIPHKEMWRTKCKWTLRISLNECTNPRYNFLFLCFCRDIWSEGLWLADAFWNSPSVWRRARPPCRWSPLSPPAALWRAPRTSASWPWGRAPAPPAPEPPPPPESLHPAPRLRPPYGSSPSTWTTWSEGKHVNMTDTQTPVHWFRLHKHICSINGI